MKVLEEMNKYHHLSWEDKVAIIAVRLKDLEKEFEPPSAPVTHRFEKGYYVRTMTIPKDTIFIGRKHLRGHEVHLLEGHAIYITPKGKFEVQAPYSICSAPGFYMVAYTVTDVRVETWHADPEGTKDPIELEARDFDLADNLISRGRALLTQKEVA